MKKHRKGNNKNMEQKLERLYLECINELKKIGINIIQNDEIGEVDIKLSKRNNKRYGVCKQEEPDKSTKYIERYRGRRFVKYLKFNKHHIEISPWVMELNDNIIKNTILHELIHCMPNCSNHGEEFKKHAKYINAKLGYDISRVRKQRRRL